MTPSAAAVVGRAPVIPQLYRVVSNPEQIVPRSATHMCRGCYGDGRKRDGSTCGWCEGRGRLLSGPDGSEWVWPVPVEPVEGSTEGSR